MRKVNRIEEPDSLKKNKVKWTIELLDEITKQGEYSKVSSTLKDRYRQEDVKETLKVMYSSLCCYCESKIGVSDFGRIEHLRPKALPFFYHLHFEWNNLHWCCEKCNTYKNNKWDEVNPIVDPSNEDPKDHIRFVYDQLNAKTLRGKTTIDHANLNRKELVEARGKVLAVVMRMVEKAYDEEDDLLKSSLYDELYLMVEDGEEYCSFLKHLIDRYLKPQWVKTS